MNESAKQLDCVRDALWQGPINEAKAMPHIPGIHDLQTIFDVIPSPVLVKDRDHRIVMLNSSACDLFGHSRKTLLTSQDTELFSREEVQSFHEADDQVFASGEDFESEETFADAEGSIKSVITRKRLISLGGKDLLVAVLTDVTARREIEAHNRYLAFHDALTGLPNRALLKDRIERALLLKSSNRKGCALLYIDLDRFKEVNDGHGHKAGDALIRDFASRLSEIVRTSDTVARIGGDEFAILMPQTNARLDVDELCGRIVAAASQAFDLSEGRVFVGASIGVAFAPARRIDQVELQRRADVALYQAKNAGRSCWRVFTAELDEGIRKRAQIEAEMRVALETGTGFEVHYQPLLSVRGEALVGVEALVRWQNPRAGLLMPDQFISIAEESGLIVPLGQFVLDTAIAMVARWPSMSVAVNVSPVQLRHRDIVRDVIASVERGGISPDRLQVEVTESTILEVNSVAADALGSLRAAGIKIVLDDFGTGYSSLSHLQKLRVDKVKIDRSFVDRIGQGEDTETIIHAVASLCRKLGISVTAEGVETDEQRQFLRSSACTELQGYFFARPLPQKEAQEYLGAYLNEEPVAA